MNFSLCADFFSVAGKRTARPETSPIITMFPDRNFLWADVFVRTSLWLRAAATTLSAGQMFST